MTVCLDANVILQIFGRRQPFFPAKITTSQQLILAERRFVIGLNRWKTPTPLAVSSSKAGCKPALRGQNELLTASNL